MSKTVIRTLTVSFCQMDKKTGYALLQSLVRSLITALLQKIVDALETLEHSLSGNQSLQLGRSLQKATRAEQDGANIKVIIAAPIHDIIGELAPANHSQIATAII